MIIFPAIDLRHGRVVRLRQGDPEAMTVFSDDPLSMARQWQAAGAEWLHLVNLDGAFSGTSGSPENGQERSANLEAVAAITGALKGIKIEFGGGLRDLASVRLLLGLGVTRVVLGTVALTNPALVEEALKEFGAEAIAVGLDARDGFVATHGWQDTSEIRVIDLAQQMKERGVKRVIYTDISRDGMLRGVNVEATAELARASGLQIIASGGVAGLADIIALKKEESTGIEGVITGQAIYTGALDLKEAIEAGR